MPIPMQNLHRAPAPTFSAQKRYLNDLQYRDMLFVYPVLLVKNEMNEDVETYPALPPHSVRCSFQEHALNSEHTEPARYGSRMANIFTRYKGFVKWHDRVVCRGITMVVVSVLDHYDNVTGEFYHTEISAQYIDEKGSINTEAKSAV